MSTLEFIVDGRTYVLENEYADVLLRCSRAKEYLEKQEYGRDLVEHMREYGFMYNRDGKIYFHKSGVLVNQIRNYRCLFKMLDLEPRLH